MICNIIQLSNIIGGKFMNKETKKERFARIADARRTKILDTIRLLENCSNKSNYDYSPDEINALCAMYADTQIIRHCSTHQ